MSEKAKTANQASGAPAEETLSTHDRERIRAAIAGLRHGSVTVLVQDGVVVQLDRTEKTRLR